MTEKWLVLSKFKKFVIRKKRSMMKYQKHLLMKIRWFVYFLNLYAYNSMMKNMKKKK